MSLTNALWWCSVAAQALGASGEQARPLVAARVEGVSPYIGVWIIVGVPGKPHKLVITAGAGCVAVVVPAEVLALAALARHAELVVYVRRSAPVAIDYHIPSWFLATVVWASKFSVRIVPEDVGSEVPVLHVNINNMRFVCSCHDFERENGDLSRLEGADADEFTSAVEVLETRTITISSAATRGAVADGDVVATPATPATPAAPSAADAVPSAASPPPAPSSPAAAPEFVSARTRSSKQRSCVPAAGIGAAGGSSGVAAAGGGGASAAEHIVRQLLD